MHARSEHEDALVLRSVDYGESDRIVTLLTSRHGKVGVHARGARKSQRRFAGALEPFALLGVEFSLGSGELGRLVSAQVKRPFPRLLRDLEAMSAAGEAMRFVREIVPEREPDPAVFATAVTLLELLEREAGKPLSVLYAFELRLLAMSGFSPRLSACGSCGKHPARAQAAEFDPVRGYLVCRQCGGAVLRLSGVTRERLSQALHDSWIASLSTEWSARELEEAHALLTAFLRHRFERASPESQRG